MCIHIGLTYALTVNISSMFYRMHLTANTKQNPLVAPSFCMLLRKHLIGSRIVSIENDGLERIITIEFSCLNELNDSISKKLIIELMGKHSNIILVNNNNRIIDSVRLIVIYYLLLNMFFHVHLKKIFLV